MITESNSGHLTVYTAGHLAAYAAEYFAGIDLFNEREFHAAHDAWEERWLGAAGPREKLYLQALIQSAVAFHHLELGRAGAARRMYTMAMEKFDRLGESSFMSLDIADFRRQMGRALGWLFAADDPRTLSVPAIEYPVIRLTEGVGGVD